MRKREFSQLKSWMRQRDFSAYGIQTGPNAALRAHLVLEFYQLFHSHTSTGSQVAKNTQCQIMDELERFFVSVIFVLR